MRKRKKPPSASKSEPTVLQRRESGSEEPQSAETAAPLIPEELPDDPKELIALFARLEQRSHSGPLPAPWTLEQYKEVDPRALDWIFDTATNEQENRHWCDKEPLRQAGRAQIFAFIIAILVILVGGGLLYLDKSAEGLATILVPLATILGVFVYKEVKGKREIKQKEDVSEADSI